MSFSVSRWRACASSSLSIPVGIGRGAVNYRRPGSYIFDNHRAKFFTLSGELGACRELLREVKQRLDHQAGVVVLHRLPIENYAPEELKCLFWLLGCLLARPVVQTIDGRVLEAHRAVRIAQ